VTRPGIEGGPNVTGSRLVTVAPKEGGALERPAVVSGCNECNEVLDKARIAIADARRLALIAQNALINLDVQRAHAALRELHAPTSHGLSKKPRLLSAGREALALASGGRAWRLRSAPLEHLDAAVDVGELLLARRSAEPPPRAR
jgi:hypothetical protein